MGARLNREKRLFKDRLRGEGLKWTPQREEVLKAALSLGGHFQAEELAYRMRKMGSRVSRATIYRTLPLLLKAGFIKEVIHGEKHLHYESVQGDQRHDHLICLKCGRIIEFQDDVLREAQERICRENRFRAQKVLHEIYGLCESCQ